MLAAGSSGARRTPPPTAVRTSASAADSSAGALSLSTMRARMPSTKSPCSKQPWMRFELHAEAVGEREHGAAPQLLEGHREHGGRALVERRAGLRRPVAVLGALLAFERGDDRRDAVAREMQVDGGAQGLDPGRRAGGAAPDVQRRRARSRCASAALIERTGEAQVGAEPAGQRARGSSCRPRRERGRCAVSGIAIRVRVADDAQARALRDAHAAAHHDAVHHRDDRAWDSCGCGSRARTRPRSSAWCSRVPD